MHVYTLEVVGDVREKEVEELVSELEGSVLNDSSYLLWPEPTTENLAISLYKLIEGAHRIRVREDDLLESVFDGENIFVAVSHKQRGHTLKVGIKGEMDERGFAVDLKALYGEWITCNSKDRGF